MQFHVITKPGCPHCDRAKVMLDERGLPYTVDVCDTKEAVATFKAAGFKTFPQVYRGAQLIGGADELQAFLVDISTEDDF